MNEEKLPLQCPYCGYWFDRDKYWEHRNHCIEESQ
jgi:uncharacterized C2H2 Zn-finger protein